MSGQQKLGQALKTVCIHRALEFSANEEKCSISFGLALEAGKTDSEFIPMTLHPGTISSHALRDDLYNWEPSPEVEVRVAPHVKVPEELARAMPNVLKMLVSCPAGFADDWDEEGGTAVACLLWLEASHFAEGPPWKLTATGLESITCCISISVGKKFCSRVSDKDELREGGSVFQLMLELKDQGWEHFELPRKKKEFPMSVVPYVLGGDVMTSAKRWYTKVGQACNAWYLRCLIFPKLQCEVELFKGTKFYKDYLGVEYVQRTTKRRCKTPARMKNVPEQDWPADHLPPLKEKKKKQKKPRRNFVNDDEPESEPEGSASSGAASATEEESSSASEGGSEDGSDKSSSSSSSNGSSSGTLTPSTSAASTPPAVPVGEPRQKRQRVMQDAGALPQREENIAYGPHRLTWKARDADPSHPGSFECSCGDHRGDKPRCTKANTISAATGGVDGCLRRLKYWSFLGKEVDVQNKSDHKERWGEVMQVWREGMTPTMAQLDTMMVAREEA